MAESNSAAAAARRAFKLAALHVMKACGAFALARRATAGGLRILCYHGISLADEHEFHGQLFMRPETFERRMKMVKAKGYHVIPLSTASAALAAGRVPAHSVVITIDDGWLGTFDKALPVMNAVGFPATIYVTTLHVAEQTPVTDVLLAYVLWLGRDHRLDLSMLDISLSGVHELGDESRRKAVAGRILAARPPSCDGRALIERVARALDVDYARIEQLRLMRLMTLAQVRELGERGIDIQLHTHSHPVLVPSREQLEQEIALNRAILGDVTCRPLVHFCYPSGEYDERHLPWLAALGIETATTCKPGLNHVGTNAMELNRFLDGENISDIEFEAELTGVLDLLRRVRSGVRRALLRKPVRLAA